jgi:hypothetical protein
LPPIRAMAGGRIGDLILPSGSSDFILAAMAVAGSSRFVGRGEELPGLLVALERAEQGRPAVVLVAGDAGVGKTHLLAELGHQAHRRGALVLVGGCLEVGDVGLPYVPVVAALRGLPPRPTTSSSYRSSSNLRPDRWCSWSPSTTSSSPTR